jgi:DNA mismatch repair protein MSH2
MYYFERVSTRSSQLYNIPQWHLDQSLRYHLNGKPKDYWPANSMQVDDESGFISFFNRLPSTDAIRLFERNDFYTVHGPDAVYVATTVYKTTSVIRQLGSARNGLQSCTLSITAFRNFLREVLFVQGKRVEIWQQKGRGSWEVGKTASPGNLQDVEEDLGSSGDAAPVIVAVKVQAKGEERNVGVCFADASVRELGIAEFADNEVYSNLEVSVAPSCFAERRSSDGE